MLTFQGATGCSLVFFESNFENVSMGRPLEVMSDCDPR